MPAWFVSRADALAARSSLRKLFETADNAAAIACYRDEGKVTLIDEGDEENGLTVAPDARSF